jgi:hypothetical protein
MVDETRDSALRLAVSCGDLDALAAGFVSDK